MMTSVTAHSRRRLASLFVATVVLASTAACGQNASGDASPAGGVDASGSSSTASGVALPESIKSSGVLRVGISPDFEPAEFYRPGTKEIAGYDPDLIKAIAANLGLTVEFVPVGYDGLIPGLQSRRFDVVMSGLTDTVEREKEVSFVDYMKHYQVFFTLKENKAGVSGDMLSVCGKRIAAEKGSITVDYTDQVKKTCKDAGQPEPSVTLYDNQTATTMAVQSGRIDAGFRSPLAMPVLQKATNNAFVSFKVDQIPSVLLGIATAKDDQQLLDALLTGLKNVQADGTYDKILGEWGVSDVAFKEPGINIAGTNPSAVPK